MTVTKSSLKGQRNSRPKKTQTGSNYKSHNTVKYINAISPQGPVTLIFKGWGGRTSDKCNAEQSALLVNHIPDVLLADKGFDISDSVALYHCKVDIPQFTRGKKQLGMMEIQDARDLVSQRIPVERVIGILRHKYTLL